MHEHPATDASDPSDPTDPTASIERAARFLDKVRLFASGLDPDERELLATLLGPGVALAHRPAPSNAIRRSGTAVDTDDDPDTYGFDHAGFDHAGFDHAGFDHAGFDHAATRLDDAGSDDLAADDGTTTWTPSTLPSYLADALRSRGADVTGPATSWPTDREPD